MMHALLNRVRWQAPRAGVASFSLLLLLALGSHGWGQPPRDGGDACLIVVLDGLRSDYVTEEIMPNLHRFGEEGIVARTHHVAFPPHTRVNATTLATGVHPARHGILSNALFLPGLGRDVDTANAARLQEADRDLGGELITAVSLAEILEEHGRSLVAVSSGSTGSALLLNPRIRGGGVVNARGLIVRPTGEEEEAEFPRRRRPNVEQNRWAVKRLLEEMSGEELPGVVFLWISDPDNTAHGAGVGSPRTLEALRHVDELFGDLLAALEKRELLDRINIFVTTDHGFSTHVGGFDVGGALREAGLDAGVRLCAYGEQIFLTEPDDERLQSIASLLAQQPPVGALFSHPASPGSMKGRVEGTFSYDLVHWNHPRAPDLLALPAWSDDINEHGYAGASTYRGTAGHNSAAPHEMRVWLIASGPGIKRGVSSDVPTGNIDLAATCLHLLGIPGGERLDGRVLHELLKAGPDPAAIPVQRHLVRLPAEAGEQRPGGFEWLEAGGARYVGVEQKKE